MRPPLLDPPNTPEAELKKRTLTNLYNVRAPDPADVAKEVILERVLGLS